MVSKKEARNVSIYSSFMIATVTYVVFLLMPDGALWSNAAIIGAVTGFIAYLGMIR